MLGPYSCDAELTLSQEQSVHFKLLPGPKRTRRFWTMLGINGAYVGPLLIHVKLLGTMLGPRSCHAELT